MGYSEIILLRKSFGLFLRSTVAVTATAVCMLFGSSFVHGTTYTVNPARGVPTVGNGLTAYLEGTTDQLPNGQYAFVVYGNNLTPISTVNGLFVRVCEKVANTCSQWGGDTAVSAGQISARITNSSFVHTSGTKTFYLQRVTSGGVLSAGFKSGEFTITANVVSDTTPPTISSASGSGPSAGYISVSATITDASPISNVQFQFARDGIFTFAYCSVGPSSISGNSYSVTVSNSVCPALIGAQGPIYYRIYAADSAGNSVTQPVYPMLYSLYDPGNQRPTLSSAAATLNSSGSLTASITHVDPENDGMRLRASLVDVNGNVVAGSIICLPDCSTYGLGNTTSSVTWSAAQMASLTTPGSSYRVRFEVADYQSTTTPIYSVMDTGLISIPIPFSVSTLQPRTGVVNTVVPVTVTGTGFTGNINLQITNQNPSPCTQVTWATTSATFNCALSSTGTTWSADVRAEQSTAVKYSVAFTVTAVATPTVTSITPGAARLDARTTFYVTGTSLTSGMVFTVEGCDQVSEQAGGTSILRTWTCYPRTPGVKQSTLKTPDGLSVAGGTAQIRVEHPQRMGDSAARGNPSVAGVHLFNGNLFLRFIDLFVPGRGLSAVFERTYNSYDWQYEADYGSVRPNSPWRFNFETRIGYSSTVPGNQRLYVAKADGSGESYFLSSGNWVPIDLGNFTTVKVNANGTYTLQTRGQISYTYEAPSTGKLLSMSDRDGNTLSFRYGPNGKVDQVTDVTGRVYTITTDGNGRVTRISDFTNRYVQYTYTDASGRIATFRDVRGKMTRYTYNAANDLETIIEPNQYFAATPIPALKVAYTNVYGNRGVQSLTTAMGRAAPTRTCPGVTEFTYCFGFTQLANNAGFRTVVDGPENANALTIDFDNAGRAISTTDAKGHQNTTDFELVTATDAYAKGSLAKVRKSALGLANGYQNTLTNNLTHGLLEVAKDAENSTSTTVWNIDEVSNLFTPSTVASTLGYTSRLDYTPSGRPNNIIAPKQYALNGATAPSTQIAWTNGTVSGITDPNNNQITLTRDGHGNLTVSTDPRDPNFKTTRVPDALGRARSVTDARGGVTRYTYDDAGNVTSTTQEVPGAADIVNLYHYDDNGNMDQHTDPRLTVTTYTYDAGNRLTGASKTLSGQTVTRGFDYDGANRLISMTNARNNQSTRTFDSAGRVEFEHLPLSRTTRYEYDADNRITKITDPMGRTVTYAYDRVGRVKSVTSDASGLNLVQRYEYDADGRLWKFYDQRTNLTEYGYDENGNLTSVKDANGVTSSATYDNANRMISRKDPRQKETLYEYDKAGNLTKETDPELNVWEYEYDENSNLIKVHNPDLISGAKRTITHQYDAANRRKQTTYSSGATVTYAYDANSNLTSMTDSIGTTSYDTYDEENRLTQFTDPFNNKVKYTYDKAGNRGTVEYPGAPGQRVVTYGYDNAERMLSVLDWTGRQAIYEYNFADQITKLTHGNGTTAEYGYDSAGRLTSLVNKQQPSGTVISSHTHTLDEFGNIRVADETLPLQPTLTPRLKQWNVDSANRVLSDTVSGDTFEHDAAGRMIRQVISGVPTNFSYNDLDLLSSLNRPGLAESYRYNGQGHRLERTVNAVATRFLVEPNGAMPNILAELSGSVPERMYVYGANGLLAQIDGAESYRAYHFSPSGNTIALSNGVGTVADTYATMPYGETLPGAGNTSVNPFKFIGQLGVHDDGNGTVNMRARYYHVSTARFMGLDAMRGGISSSQTINRIAYAGGNPINRADPTGLYVEGSSPYTGYVQAPDGTPYMPGIQGLCGLSPCTTAEMAGTTAPTTPPAESKALVLRSEPTNTVTKEISETNQSSWIAFENDYRDTRRTRSQCDGLGRKIANLEKKIDDKLHEYHLDKNDLAAKNPFSGPAYSNRAGHLREIGKTRMQLGIARAVYERRCKTPPGPPAPTVQPEVVSVPRVVPVAAGLAAGALACAILEPCGGIAIGVGLVVGGTTAVAQ